MIAQDPKDLLSQAVAGSRSALARLLTYVESGGAHHRETVALAYTTPAPFVIGITGPPGAGKSTLTDVIIAQALQRGSIDNFESFDQIAVLAVDPSSPFTGGALLGDRVRMQEHAMNEHVFIRSMAARGHLGGLSLAVPDSLRVIGAASFPVVLVETVGVGQMEVDIASTADTTIVVTNPGWGDSMQANKAGLLEIADIFVINKSDRAGVNETRRDLEQMLKLGRARDWQPIIVETSATSGAGVSELLDAVEAHRQYLGTDVLRASRERRIRSELDKVMSIVLRERVTKSDDGELYENQIRGLLDGTTDPYRAAEQLLGAS